MNLSIKISYHNQNAQLRYWRKDTYINCWEIRDLLRSHFTVGQFMGGWPKTFTHVVTRNVQPSPCLRSKMGTASVATRKLSRNLRGILLKILLPSSSTSQNKGASQTNHKRSMRFFAKKTWDLRLQRMVVVPT
jgi:hypothetical protein